jgi:hypothetical protein
LIYFLIKNTLKNNHYHHIFETRPGPTGRPRTRGWNRTELKKKREKKKPGVTWLTRRVDLARPGCKLVDFCFFFCFFLLKRRRFDFLKKKLTRPTWWPGQNPEPGLWTGPATGPGLKTMTIILSNIFLKTNINVKPPANAWKSSEELEILVFKWCQNP